MLCPLRRPVGAGAAVARGRLGGVRAVQKLLKQGCGVRRGRFPNREEPRRIHSLLRRWVPSQRGSLGPPGFPRNGAVSDAKPGRILGASPDPPRGLPDSLRAEAVPAQRAPAAPSLCQGRTWDPSLAHPPPIPRYPPSPARPSWAKSTRVPRVCGKKGQQGGQTGELMFSVECSTVLGCFSATSTRLLQVTSAFRTHGREGLQ